MLYLRYLDIAIDYGNGKARHYLNSVSNTIVCIQSIFIHGSRSWDIHTTSESCSYYLTLYVRHSLIIPSLEKLTLRSLSTEIPFGSSRRCVYAPRKQVFELNGHPDFSHQQYYGYCGVFVCPFLPFPPLDIAECMD